ncbi:hypothetical protein [Pseudomonas tohonis]|uniref:hypothetical protein n=1 Tax=Pseudomonas tohonis TaxID=2725477 RepID=UPI0015645292|nr:hypothetical protein [Pseudomonas tohonis]
MLICETSEGRMGTGEKSSHWRAASVSIIRSVVGTASSWLMKPARDDHWHSWLHIPWRD